MYKVKFALNKSICIHDQDHPAAEMRLGGTIATQLRGLCQNPEYTGILPLKLCAPVRGEELVSKDQNIEVLKS